MSKRTRGGPRTQRRSGARPPASRPNPTTRQVTQPSELEAAEIIAEDIVEERPASAANELEKVARATSQRGGRPKPGSLLAERAASEYVYVAQDMRRILVVAGSLFGVLFLLWLLIVVLKVIPLPFY